MPGPFDRAGLKIGDLILSIDGKSAKGLTTEEVSGMLKGEPGSKVKITVMHLDSTQQSVTLRRERISIPGVPYAGWVKEGIGYIRHSDFTEGCYEEMRAAIDRLRAEGELKGLVLDYRSNGGGIMQEAVKILSLFVPRGTVVVTTRGRNEQRDYRTEAEPILPDLPLAVLVDGSTASSSEIVAGALQDLDRAVLIGQRSFGKGLVQATRPLGYNTMLKLTTAKYYIPSGRCIQAIDYSHSQEGSVRTVPDSLISEFETRAGRKVYDGGGIMPDIDVEPEYISRFAATLYALGFIEDFGDEYTRRNPGQQIDIRTFSITDADYADFAAFMQDKEVPYESDTRRALKALKKAAEDDRFAELKEQFERVESELKDDTATNLETYREQVIEAINNDIILRHAYTAGVIEHAMADDKGLPGPSRCSNTRTNTAASPRSRIPGENSGRQEQTRSHRRPKNTSTIHDKQKTLLRPAPRLCGYGLQQGGSANRISRRRMGRRHMRGSAHRTVCIALRARQFAHHVRTAPSQRHRGHPSGTHRIQPRLGAPKRGSRANGLGTGRCRIAAIRRDAPHHDRRKGTHADAHRTLCGRPTIRDAACFAARDRQLHTAMAVGRALSGGVGTGRLRSQYEPPQLLFLHPARNDLLSGGATAVQRSRRAFCAEHPPDAQRERTHGIHGRRQPQRERRTADHRQHEIQPRPMRLRPGRHLLVVHPLRRRHGRDQRMR